MSFSFKDIAKKSSYALLLQALSLVLILLLNWYLALKLGASEYGKFTYAFSWVYLLGALCMLGMNTVIQRELIKLLPEQFIGLFRFAKKTTWIVAGIAVPFFALIAYYLLSNSEHQLLAIMALAIVSLPFFSQSLLHRSVCVGAKKVVWSMIPVDIVRPLITLVACFLLWEVYPTTTISAVIVNVLSIVLVLIVALYFTGKTLPKIAVKPVHNDRKWIKLGVTFFFLSASVMINSKADILMLGFYGYTDLVGIYNIAVKLALIIGIPLTIANKVLVPYISRYIHQETHRLTQVIKKGMRIIFFVGSLVALLYYFKGDTLLGLFGEEFTAGYMPLIVLTVSQLLNIFVGPVGNLLSMSRFEQTSLVIMVTSTVINILLNIILIPQYKMEGAAIATGISLVFWNVAQFIVVKKRLKINPSVI